MKKLYNITNVALTDDEKDKLIAQGNLRAENFERIDKFKMELPEMGKPYFKINGLSAERIEYNDTPEDHQLNENGWMWLDEAECWEDFRRFQSWLKLRKFARDVNSTAEPTAKRFEIYFNVQGNNWDVREVSDDNVMGVYFVRLEDAQKAIQEFNKNQLDILEDLL